MANRTPYLGLVLPANGEYTNTWDEPVNDNFTKVDSAIDVVTTEVQTARFQMPSLAEFLAVSLNPDGTLKPADDVVNAQNSLVYGSYDQDSLEDYTLEERISLGDAEVFNARSGAPDLLTALSVLGTDFSYPDSVIFGATTAEGEPNFMAVSAANFILDATPIPITFNIAGRRMVLSADANIPVSGTSGTKYLVAEIPTTPYKVVDSTEDVGVTSSDAAAGGRIRVFTDPGRDFTTNIRPGMVLRITTAINPNVGTYVIDEVGYNSDVHALTVIGVFKSAEANMSYTIEDPLRPAFSVVDTLTGLTFGTAVIGEASFATTPMPALTGAVTYSFKHKYESTYIGVDTSLAPTGIAEIAFTHNLGFIPKSITVLVSSGADGLPYTEPMSTTGFGHNLGVMITNSLVFDPGVWTAGGTVPPDYNPLPSLSGTVTGSLTGAIQTTNSVRVKADRTTLVLKNITTGYLYTDYDGAVHGAGFIKVLVS